MPVADFVDELAEHHGIARTDALRIVLRCGKEIAAAEGTAWPFNGQYVHPTWLVGLRRSCDAAVDAMQREDAIADRLAGLAQRVADARAALAQATAERDSAVADALDAGLSVERVRYAAGLGRPRVYQIKAAADAARERGER